MDFPILSHADALANLRHVTPTANTEMPSFVAAPQAIATRDFRGEMRLIFQCTDSANEAEYVVEVPCGDRPATLEEANARVLECGAAALGVADRIAKAVFN